MISVWIPVVIAILGAVGTLGAALINAWIQYKIAKLNRGKVHSTESGSEEPNNARKAAIRRLNAWRPISLVLWLLSLAALIAIVLLPGEANWWFLRINVLLIAVSTVSCASMFTFLNLLLMRLDEVEDRLDSFKEVWLRALTYFAGIVFIMSFGYLSAQFMLWVSKPPNEKLVFAAWTEYNEGNYRLAIDAANGCISRFGPNADRIEAGLAGTVEPPVGSVSAQQSQIINRNGVLNDVAACYWIKGDSSLKLNDKTLAKASFESAAHLIHARIWDGPNVWSPAEDAQDRLNQLGQP